jgi:hypothetical protein
MQPDGKNKIKRLLLFRGLTHARSEKASMRSIVGVSGIIVNQEMPLTIYFQG